MINAYVDAVAALDHEGPLAFVGWSMGGFLAHDVASRQQARGKPVEAVAILDSVNQENLFEDVDRPPDARIETFDAFLEQIVERYLPASLVHFQAVTSWAERLLILANAAEAATFVLPDDPCDRIAQVERFVTVSYRNGILMKERPVSRAYGGPVLVIRANDTTGSVADLTLGWTPFCGSVATVDVPFAHNDLLEDQEAARVVMGAVASWLSAKLSLPTKPKKIADDAAD